MSGARPRLALCGFGEAARLGLETLEALWPGIAAELLCFTYDRADNAPFLDALERRGVAWTAERLRGERALLRLKEHRPDLVVSLYYRHRIPVEALAAARRGGINLHPSLLPRYRGAFSAPWVILNGESETGITWHFMNERFDDGAIVVQRRVAVAPDETARSLYEKLVRTGVGALPEALARALDERFAGIPQEGEPSYYPREVPFGGAIDPAWPRERVERFIRAMHFPPKPGAVLVIDGTPHEVASLAEYDALVARFRDC